MCQCTSFRTTASSTKRASSTRATTRSPTEIRLLGLTPFGSQLLLEAQDQPLFKLHIELCDDV